MRDCFKKEDIANIKFYINSGYPLEKILKYLNDKADIYSVHRIRDMEKSMNSMIFSEKVKNLFP